MMPTSGRGLAVFGSSLGRSSTVTRVVNTSAISTSSSVGCWAFRDATRLNTPAALDSANIDRGESNYDIRHGFTLGMTYDLPSSGYAVLRGWSLDAFALPVDIVVAVYNAAAVAVMPLATSSPGSLWSWKGRAIRAARSSICGALLAAAPGRQGESRPRGAARVRRFSSRCGLRANLPRPRGNRSAFRPGVFQSPESPQFGSPANTLTSALFGRSTTQMLAYALGAGGQNGDFNPLYQLGGPRSTHMAMTLEF
jgi:hypothetical protein